MSQRHRSALLAAVIFAAFGAGAGCEKDKVEAPAPSEADAPWKALVAELDGDLLTVHEKSRALDEFEARFPSNHPYEKELAQRRRTIEKAVKDDLAAQASRVKTYEAEHKAASERRRTAIESGSLTSLAGEILFLFAPWEDELEQEGFAPVAMEVESKAPRVRHSPFQGMGMGSMRVALQDLMAEAVPDMAREKGEYRERHDRMNESFNLLLRGRLGARLFYEDNPGAIDPAALEKLLDEVYVDPDTPFLGSRARDAYRLFRPIVWDYARVYVSLNKRFGKRKLVAAYKKGLRKYDGSSDETSMMIFYSEFARKHGVADKAGLKQTWGSSVIVGFWMRRAADGTDQTLVAFLRKVADGYDPELAKLLR